MMSISWARISSLSLNRSILQVQFNTQILIINQHLVTYQIYESISMVFNLPNLVEQEGRPLIRDSYVPDGKFPQFNSPGSRYKTTTGSNCLEDQIRSISCPFSPSLQ